LTEAGFQYRSMARDNRVMTFIPRPEETLLPVYDRTISVIERGAGGVPLIFIHGGGPGGDSWLDFSPVLEYFGDRRVVFLDLPQYGGSSKEPIVGPYLSYHAKYIVGAMDAIDIDRADFCAGSTGSLAELVVAVNYPDRVRRLVVSGAQPVPVHPTIRDHQYTIGDKLTAPLWANGDPTYDVMRTLILDAEWYDPATLPEERIQVRLKGLLDQKHLEGVPGVRGEPEDVADRLSEVGAPTLFFYGGEDPFLDGEYAMALSRIVQHGDVHIMAKASHHLFAERPRDFALILHSFLDADLGE
jgi:2-hydroxy-6-oxonona-2,4-dienedioate hydrolase